MTFTKPVLLASSALLLLATPALAQTNTFPTDPTQEIDEIDGVDPGGPIVDRGPTSVPEEEIFIDEVVATGIRASLDRSIDVKRNADSIVDAISFEELGKFPDTNVAESLQRITGVAITRARGGEGQFVTVRGLGEEFNAVTYNNRLLATENAGREFSFDTIASEVISGAQIFKSPTASQGDGSIGGRVNVVSAKPLDQPGFQAAGSVAGQYDSLSDDVGPKLSGVVSNTWDTANGTFGVLASAYYQDREIRTDVAESIFIETNATVLGNSIVAPGTPGSTSGNRLNSFAASVAEQDRERFGGTLAFQWAPDDTTEITIDGLYTSFDSPSEVFGYSYFPVLNGPNPQIPGSTAENTGIIDGSVTVNDANQILSAASILPNAAEVVGRLNDADTDTFQIGANLKKEFEGGWDLNLDASYSEAQGVRDAVGSAGGSGAFYVLGWVDGFFSQQATGGRVPDIVYTGADTVGGPQQQLSELTAQDVRLHFARNTSSEISDEIFTARGDLKKDLGNAALLGGLDITIRQKGQQRFDNLTTQCQFCGYATPLASVAPGLVEGFFETFDDSFLSTTSADIPRAIPTFSLDTFEAVYDLAAAGGFGGLTLPDGSVVSALTPVFNPAASNVVDEDVYGGYLQADFSGDLGNFPFQANAGVRFAYTDLTSTGAGAEVVSVTTIDTNNQSFTEVTTDIEEDNDYFDVLPAFNISVDLRDDIVTRLGFSRSLTRPTLTDLSTFFAVTSTNIGGEQIVAGNPDLEATRSNNVDFSLEYYGDQGLTLTGAAFYKDISDFITNQNVPTFVDIPEELIIVDGVAVVDPNPQGGREFLISQPLNGDNAEVYGVEFAAQYIHESGVGASGNVTFAESTATAGGISAPLENISDISANASIFYEKGPIQARAALNYRSDYLFSTAGEGGLAEIVDDFTQVDLSASYQITENFAVFGEGQNVFNEEFFRFSETPDLLETFEENGARWILGIRARY